MATDYTYVHARPDGSIFYVGKGRGNRYRVNQKRNAHHQRITNKYGVDNILVGKIDCTSHAIALDLEIGIIKCLKRMGVKLANQTLGGEGALGRVILDSTREKRREIFLGRKRPNHAEIMKAKGHWAKENNPGFGKGAKQAGAKNHMARAVIGVSKLGEARQWSTLSETAQFIGVSLQAICQALRKGMKSKGWTLRYKV